MPPAHPILHLHHFNSSKGDVEDLYITGSGLECESE